MGITYFKLREMLIDREITHKRLKADLGLSNDVLAKINKDEYMGLEPVERIARYLKVDIGDIVEIKK